MPRASEHKSSTITKLPYHYKERRTEIFWMFVDRTLNGCWEWTGKFRRDGYGSFCGKPAQWYSWQLANGARKAHKEICHSCDNKRCVNPAHLFEGSHKENMEDAAYKGLMGRPKSIPDHIYLEVKCLVNAGKNQNWIAEKCGVSQAYVSGIKAGRYGR